jgi:outer membrane protein OmpA-like peptidoglycan-associated protein
MKSIVKTITFVTASTIALTACETGGTPVYNGERTQSGAVAGALIGGLVTGAAADSDRLAKGVIGAAVGAAVGGAIGQRLDRQARDLEANMNNPDVRIVNTGRELIVTLPQDILFATDSASVAAGLRSDIRALANNLQDYPNSIVRVLGHTDSTGSAAYNQDLSARRASAVASILFDNGVSASRVRAMGRGEDEPIATNLTPQGQAQNRRVEIIIQPTA